MPPEAVVRADDAQLSACIPEPGGPVTLVQTAAPRICGDEVLVHAGAVGICGSDLEVLEGTRPADLVRYPVTPGHEWSGTVVSSGREPEGLHPGQSVVCEGLLYCGVCENCRHGLTNLCLRGYDELGFTRPGGLAGLVAVPRRAVHALPSDLPLHAAALLEPAAVVAHAFLRARPRPGAVIAVLGDGALGQLAVQMARAYGARAVVLSGMQRGRLDLARDLGPVEVVEADGDEAAALVRARSAGLGADLVVETAGDPAAVATATQLARRGGTVALEGLAGGGRQVTLGSDLFVLKHLTVLGICGAVPAAWEHAIALTRSGQLALEPLITHRFDLHSAPRRSPRPVAGTARP